MKLITITTWNNRLYKEYAHRFEATYNWSWPYTVYNEDDGMYDAIPDLKAFVERNKDRPAKDFLQDAVRFSYKVYGYCHAIKQYQRSKVRQYYLRFETYQLQKHLREPYCWGR